MLGLGNWFGPKAAPPAARVPEREICFATREDALFAMMHNPDMRTLRVYDRTLDPRQFMTRKVIQELALFMGSGSKCRLELVTSVRLDNPHSHKYHDFLKFILEHHRADVRVMPEGAPGPDFMLGEPGIGSFFSHNDDIAGKIRSGGLYIGGESAPERWQEVWASLWKAARPLKAAPPAPPGP